MADLRALMKERKAAAKRIDHPYAKYSNAGQLSCSLCTLSVKNEVLWPAHLTSKVHRQNVRQQQIAATEDAARAEESVSTSKTVVGTKRAAEDTAGRHEATGEEPGVSAKRVRWEDEDDNDRANQTSYQDALATGLPAGFFDNSTRAPVSEASQSTTGISNDAHPPAIEDDEMAEFEAFLATEEPEASTSSAGPTVFSAQATISADEVLFNNEPEGEDRPDEEEADEEDDDGEPKESEEERLAREEREELMERIEQEEREQREADERVELLKKRLLAVRTAKKAGTAPQKQNGDEDSTIQSSGETARERRRRRLGKAM